MSFAIITENDVSAWKDQTGKQYHFPKRYLSILKPGTNVIYYKGRMTDTTYLNSRRSIEPHYFGSGKIGIIKSDPASSKHDYFATITDFSEFDLAIPFKIDGDYLENVPPNRKSNWWRDGVRVATEEVFRNILDMSRSGAIIAPSDLNDNEPNDDAFTTEVVVDGKKKEIYSTYYERDKKLRNSAIKIQGVTCLGCSTNFESKYGSWGKGFIHVHHKKPVSTGPQNVNPALDLLVVCPNCHWMIHRVKGRVLTLEELRKLISDNGDGHK